MNRGRMPGVVAVTATSALWGTTGTAATFAPEAGPLAIGSAALGLSGLLQALIATRGLSKEWPTLRSNLAAIAVGAVAVAIYPLAFYSSMHLAGVAVGSVISLASAPLASGLLERLVDKNPLANRWKATAALGAVGSILLCMSNFEAGGAGTAATVVGIGLGLVAGGTYATYSRSVQRLMHERISRAAAMGAVFGCGGVLLMPVLFATGGPLIASRQAMLVAAYVTLVPMFVGYLLFSFGLTRIPVRTATTITLLEPAFASLFAVLVVGERLTALGWVGMALLGVVLVALALEPRQREAGVTMDEQPGGPIAAATTAVASPSHQSDI